MTHKVAYRNAYVCIKTYVNTVSVDEEEAMNFKESWEGYIGGLEGRKGKREIFELKYNVKNKRTEKVLKRRNKG